MSCVRRTLDLPLPREEAWRLVVDADELATWLADDVELDPTPGGPARFTWDDGSEKVGVVEECAEERRLAWRWKRPDEDEREESVVEITLDDTDDGTRLTILEVRAVELDAAIRPLVTSAPTMRALALA